MTHCSSRSYRAGLLLGIFFSLCVAVGQVAAKPFVWEVKHVNKPGTVFIVGSIHALHENDELPAIYNTLLPLSDKVIFEADINDPNQAELIRDRAYLRSPDSLRNHLEPETYRALNAFLREHDADRIRLGSDLPVHFSQLRPWLAFQLASQAKLEEAELSAAFGVDTNLLAEARRIGKPVEFFETFDFQLGLLEAAINPNADAAILSVLNDNPETLVSNWLAGNGGAFQAEIQKFYASQPAAASILIDQRNLNWLPKIEGELNQNRQTLVVAGAAHLFGNQGLLKLLVNRGYSIARLPSAPNIIRKPVSQSTILGSTVTLTVKATGTPPLGYQWNEGNVEIAGATNASLVFTNVDLDTAGTYSVTVSNVSGTIQSTDAVISVYDVNNFTPIFVRSDESKLGLWLMDNTNFVAAMQVRGGQPFGAGWRPVGTAAFNSDTDTDILFQNADGRLSAWLMKGTALRKGVPLRSTSPAWRALALTDFNADTKTDILFRHVDGRLAVWYMDGTNFVSAEVLNSGNSVGVNWRLVGAAHFDNDGKTDLLFQNATGSLAVWLTNGTTTLSKVSLRDGIAVSAKAVGVLDLNEDGETDIVFQKPSGQMSVWYMADTNFVSASSIEKAKPLPHTWRFLGTR